MRAEVLTPSTVVQPCDSTDLSLSLPCQGSSQLHTHISANAMGLVGQGSQIFNYLKFKFILNAHVTNG